MKTIDELLDELQEFAFYNGWNSGHNCSSRDDLVKKHEARAKVDAEIERMQDTIEGLQEVVKLRKIELDRSHEINEALRKAQDYVYIGRDGKSVQARDLEDRLIAAQAQITELQDRIVELEAMEHSTHRE